MRGEISWEEYQKLKSIFEVRKKVQASNYKIDEDGELGVLIELVDKPSPITRVSTTINSLFDLLNIRHWL